MKQDMIVILDLGSHENTVLARAIRALGVYSEIYPHDITVEELKALPNVKGIIINGGPNNVIDGVAIDVNPGIYEMGTPVMAAGHDKALCEVKLPEFTDDVEAIKGAVKSFVFDTCKAEANWNMTNFVNDQIELVKRQVGDKKVLLALSGGVDSSVVAALLLKAIGDKLVCVHVNHGLMRKGESEDVVEVFKNQLNANLVYVDATDRFLDKLADVEDPEQKRKIIGGEFIRVFEEEARKLDGIDFLAQGTIYPDIVESGTKTAKMVKSHHNVGGLPEDLKFELVEPLRQLFKDEVRACGLEDERRNAGMTIDHTVISIGVLSQFNVCHIFQTQYLTVRSSSDYDLPELFRCHFTATVFHGILERIFGVFAERTGCRFDVLFRQNRSDIRRD